MKENKCEHISKSYYCRSQIRLADLRFNDCEHFERGEAFTLDVFGREICRCLYESVRGQCRMCNNRDAMAELSLEEL